MQARITGGIINIHLTVIIRNSTIGKYHVGNIADALPATRRDQKSGRFGNHFPRLHNGLVGGGAVFIRLSEPFAAGAGIDHLIQDKMVHIGGSSGIAVFSGFLVYTFFNRWPPKVSPVNHIEGCKSISPYGTIISNSFTSRSTRGHSPQNLPE